MKTSNYSTVLTVTTDPLSLDTPILDVMGTITYNSAVINWLPVDNAQGYKIYLENIDDTLVILDDLDVNNVTTYTLTGLYQNTNYQYKVKAYYNILESAYSVADDFVTTDFVILPDTINATNVILMKGDTSISEELSYEIQYRGGDTPKRFLIELISTVGSSSYADILFDYTLPVDTIKKIVFTWDNTTKTPKLYVNKTELTAYQNIPWSGGIAYSTITNIRTTNAKVLRGRYEESTTFGASKIKYYRSAIHDVIKDKTTSDLDCDTFDLT